MVKNKIVKNNCLECGKKLETMRQKKFCSHKCNSSFNAKKAYYIKKSDPEFRKKNILRSTAWISNNRERYNLLVKDANRNRARITSAQRKINGTCHRCGKINTSKWNNCDKCRIKFREYSQQCHLKGVPSN